MPSVVNKDPYSLSSLPSWACFSDSLTGWALDMGVVCSDVMEAHQNPSLTAAFTAESDAELSGVVWMEAQDAISSLCHLLQKILMYPRARAVHLEYFSCSLSGPGLYLSDFRELQDCAVQAMRKASFFSDSTNI